jgi:hypothetical protein
LPRGAVLEGAFASGECGIDVARVERSLRGAKQPRYGGPVIAGTGEMVGNDLGIPFAKLHQPIGGESMTHFPIFVGQHGITRIPKECVPENELALTRKPRRPLQLDYLLVRQSFEARLERRLGGGPKQASNAATPKDVAKNTCSA